jgi:hypothetical protein
VKRLTLEPVGWPCTLQECPPGLFLHGNEVCFKTEYGRMETTGPVNVPGSEVRWICGPCTDAYCESGEHFCVTTSDERELLMVQPLEYRWENE